MDINHIKKTRNFSFYFKDFFNRRELFYMLVVRDFKINYKQSIFSYTWLIIQPLLLMIVMTIFFSYLGKFPSDGIPYPVFILCALVPWRMFASSVGSGALSITKASGLIKQVYFPRIYLPLLGISTGVINSFFALIVLICILLYYGFDISYKMFLIPFGFLIVIILSTGISLILTSMNTFFRDAGKTVPILVQSWMYLSPIIYPITMVPDAFKEPYSYNPMVGVIYLFRWACADVGLFPTLLLFKSVAISLLIFILGLILFKRFDRVFVDVL